MGKAVAITALVPEDAQQNEVQVPHHQAPSGFVPDESLASLTRRMRRRGQSLWITEQMMLGTLRGIKTQLISAWELVALARSPLDFESEG